MKIPQRPYPPDSILDHWFIPAPEVVEWIRGVLLDENSRLFNEDHRHLQEAEIGVLWTAVPNSRQMRQVVGQAEIPMFRCGKWQKARQELQIMQWFGGIPDFLITLDALFAQKASDAEWCALIEHELYHCGQECDAFGVPKFTREGKPKFAIRGHDVEEFIGVVRRYGASAAASGTAELVKAASQVPEIARVDIAGACGTCLGLAA